MLRYLVLTVFISSSAAGDCFPITGDRIFARDLAAAIPAFASIPPDVTISYTPSPGTQRIFTAAEIARIARANNIAVTDLVNLCFEIPMHSLTADATREAMRRALPPEAELDIVELPKTNIPAGVLDFPLSGLEPALKGPRIWRGSVRYGDTLRLPVQARVNVRRTCLAVVARTELPLNQPIDLASIRLDQVSVPLDSVRLASRIEDVLGRVSKKTIHPGEAIPVAVLKLPPAVHRGDAVRVEVRSGSARLLFDAVAENPACAGDMVDLRNPSNGRTFRARLEDGGHAIVVIPSRQAL